MHDDEPLLEDRPRAQLMHDDEPLLEYRPLAQLSQSEEPLEVEYWPDGQVLQSLLAEFPRLPEYLPAGHEYSTSLQNPAS